MVQLHLRYNVLSINIRLDPGLVHVMPIVPGSCFSIYAWLTLLRSVTWPAYRSTTIQCHASC